MMILIQSFSSLIIISFLFCKNKGGKNDGSRGLTCITQSGTMKLSFRIFTYKKIFFCIVSKEETEREKSINYQNLPALNQEMLAISPFFRL